jgi:hypothetical protein
MNFNPLHGEADCLPWQVGDMKIIDRDVNIRRHPCVATFGAVMLGGPT